MRSMKRFVSYLYSIYNNQKIHNAGFARIELRTGRNRIEIHLKDIGYAGKTGTVYLFVRNEKNIQGVSIGNITFRGNQADLRYEQADEIIGQTSWTIMQMNGIIITIDKKVAFLSQWDETPVDTEKFEIWEQTDKLQDNVNKSGDEQNNSDTVKDDQEENGQNRNIQEYEEKSRNRQQIRHEDRNSRQNRHESRNSRRNGHENENRQQNGYENRNRQENGYIDRNNQRQYVNQAIGAAPGKNWSQNQISMNQNQFTQNGTNQSQGRSNQGQINREQINPDQSQEENQSQEQYGQEGMNQSQGQSGYEEMNQSQSSQEKMNQNLISKNEINTEDLNSHNGNNSGKGTDQENTDEESQIVISEQIEQSEQSSVIRTAEIRPQVQSGSQGWEQTWRYMLRAFPVIKQFDDKDDVLCIRIEIKDVRLLPDKYWSIVNNSFLLHGFFNYRYLAFGRIGQNWFIGVPGIYQNQEHAMASIFGFPDFLAQQHKNERGEQPGYWYRVLELNQQ